MHELAPGTDRLGAEVTVTAEGLWRFHVEAWRDPIAQWRHDAEIKIPRGQDVELMLAEGALLFARAAARSRLTPGQPGDSARTVTADRRSRAARGRRQRPAGHARRRAGRGCRPGTEEPPGRARRPSR